MPRAYDNRARAEAALRTRGRIAEAAVALISRVDIDTITLAAVAAEAGVTVQTVLRHVGSREGCYEAAAELVRARIDAHRVVAAPGDVDGALNGLMEHYEQDGPLVLRLLAQEGRAALASAAVQEGRAYHRAWVRRSLEGRYDPASAWAEDALVAATDLSLWKLMRWDLGRSRDQTHLVIRRTVLAILEASWAPS